MHDECRAENKRYLGKTGQTSPVCQMAVPVGAENVTMNGLPCGTYLCVRAPSPAGADSGTISLCDALEFCSDVGGRRA